jgi:translocation and assembly module TamB
MSDPLTRTPPPVARPDPSVPLATGRRRRRRLCAIVAVLGLLLVAVYFAPAVVAYTGLRNRIARAAAAELDGQLRVGRASLGWFSPIELRDVTLTDPQGRVLVQVARLTTSRTLLGVLRDRSNPGPITLERPHVEVVCGADGTNAEQVFRKLLDDTDPPRPTRTPLSVRIVGGRLTLRDAATGQSGEFHDLEATVEVPAARTEPITARLTALTPGRAEVELSLGQTGHLRLRASDLALDALAPLLARYRAGLRVGGSAAADLTAVWGLHTATLDGTLAGRNLTVSCPELHGDTLRVASASLPVKLTVSGRSVSVERADLTCDLAHVSFRGTLDGGESPAALLERPGLRLEAEVDLAKVAATLPKSLHVRDGTVFHGGSLGVKLASRATDSGTTWDGTVTTSALRASRGGRALVWEAPLGVEFAASVRAGELPRLDTLICRSDFLAVNARISPESVRAAANVDLDRLSARLSDFFDLGGYTLDGEGSAWVVARRSPGGEFKAEAGVELRRFAVTDATGVGLREALLTAQVTAAGKAPDAGPFGVSFARAVLTGGADSLQLSLAEPIPDVREPRAGRLDFSATGDLHRWKTRLAFLMPVVKDYRVAGSGVARGVARFDEDVIRVNGLSLAVENARFRGAGIDLDEPRLVASAEVTYDRRTGTATLADFTLNSALLAVTRGQLVIESPAGDALVVWGQGSAVTDLNRLGRTLGLYTNPRGPHALHGRGSGPVRFRRAGDVTTFAASLDVTDFAFGLRQNPEWAEPRLKLEFDGSYSRATDTLTLTAARLERPGLVLTAGGTLARFDTTTEANLTGEVGYDMAGLTPKLREVLGGNFTATGRGTRPVALRGSLTPPTAGTGPPNPYKTITAEFALGWDSATVYGFETGPGEVRTRLANGVARVNRVTATFGGGRVTLRPTVFLDPLPGHAVFATGWVIEKARLTPEACAGALGYAVPPFARSTRAEGEISFLLNENRIPLSDPSRATLRGTLVLHQATVTAGPVVGEVARLLGADNTTLTLANEQAVPVWVENGRVFHDNLTLKLGGYFVKTSGSAGFDGSLDLVADVPIPGGWPLLKNSPVVAKALTGKRLKVPVRGTLDKPALDPRAFQAAVAKLVQETARDAGRELLQKELEKVFPGGLVSPGPGPGGRPGGGPFPIPLPRRPDGRRSSRRGVTAVGGPPLVPTGSHGGRRAAARLVGVSRRSEGCRSSRRGATAVGGPPLVSTGSYGGRRAAARLVGVSRRSEGRRSSRRGVTAVGGPPLVPTGGVAWRADHRPSL